MDAARHLTTQRSRAQEKYLPNGCDDSSRVGLADDKRPEETMGRWDGGTVGRWDGGVGGSSLVWSTRAEGTE